jgi:hypothetical protein
MTGWKLGEILDQIRYNNSIDLREKCERYRIIVDKKKVQELKNGVGQGGTGIPQIATFSTR